MAGKLDLIIEQGSTFSRKITFREKAVSPAVGDPIDLSGCTFAGQIKKNVTDSLPVVSFQFVILDQVSNKGEVEFNLTNTQTSSIPIKAQKGSKKILEEFAYDIELTFPSGKVERILEGTAFVSPEVTKNE